MIVVKLHGGLGNQIFQYACGYRLARELGVALKFDASAFADYPRPYALNHFRVEVAPISDDEAARLKPASARMPGRLSRFLSFLPSPIRHVTEKQFCFDPAILQNKPPYYLEGYWQTEKYFAPVADSIRAQFQLAQPMTAVSVHVRHSPDKTVIAPATWFADPKPDTRDVTPPGWIRM